MANNVREKSWPEKLGHLHGEIYFAKVTCVVYLFVIQAFQLMYAARNGDLRHDECTQIDHRFDQTLAFFKFTLLLIYLSDLFHTVLMALLYVTGSVLLACSWIVSRLVKATVQGMQALVVWWNTPNPADALQLVLLFRRLPKFQADVTREAYLKTDVFEDLFDIKDVEEAFLDAEDVTERAKFLTPKDGSLEKWSFEAMWDLLTDDFRSQSCIYVVYKNAEGLLRRALWTRNSSSIPLPLSSEGWRNFHASRTHQRKLTLCSLELWSVRSAGRFLRVYCWKQMESFIPYEHWVPGSWDSNCAVLSFFFEAVVNGNEQIREFVEEEKQVSFVLRLEFESEPFDNSPGPSYTYKGTFQYGLSCTSSEESDGESDDESDNGSGDSNSS